MTSWFAWFITGAGNKTLGKRTRVATASVFIAGKLPAKRRKKQELEIYQEEHYQSRVKPLVDAEAERLRGDTGAPLDRASKLKLVKAVTKETFDKETQDVKNVIALKALNQPSPYTPQESEDGPVTRTPEQLLRYVILLFNTGINSQ